MNIFFEKETEDALSFDYEEIATKVIKKVMDYFGCEYDYSVNVYLKESEEIKDINASFRGIDKVTDVLSFPNISFEKEADFSILEDDDTSFEYFDPDSGELLLGDILICQDRMKEQALEYGHSELREYAFLITHSMLHLLGFDHIDEDERIRMENLQEQFLQELKITRD